MSPTTAAPPSPLETLADPESIRDRLYALHQEARLLRRLLRLSQAARDEQAAQRTIRREVRNAG
jgi:hypothetical protein